MCDKRVGYAVNDRLLRLGVRANLALGIWVDAEEALVVQLPLTGAAADWLWLFLLLHLWCVAANLTCLCERAVDFTHVRKGRPQPTTALKKLPVSIARQTCLSSFYNAVLSALVRAGGFYF